MITLLTSANKNFSDFINFSKELYKKYDYKFEIYDLGGLNIGKKFIVDNPLFHSKGYYCEIKPGWNSTALHKPSVIMDCIENTNKGDIVVYLDSDAIVINEIDEINNLDFDIGITIRSPNENMYWYINAGVVFLRQNERTKEFIRYWKNKTSELNNDQLALNNVINPNNILLIKDMTYDSSELNCIIKNLKIRCFSTWEYNFYYFANIDMNKLENNEYPNIKILHFKTDKRKYFNKFVKNNKSIFCWMDNSNRFLTL